MDILRKIVASPRARHDEANLDLCYVTPNLIATSGPSGTYPQLVYRNPLSQLVKFLDSKHADNWAIWEFRAEGTGYPDEEVYGRIRHYPWPDHHPPPFALVPLMMASMREWRRGNEQRVCVVHCKAGKGRSGTVSCSYLISEEGWTATDAMQRFTEKRMRPGFGAGISIPSQVRWVGYVDRWRQGHKLYVEKQVEVLEVHVWGLRDGVKIAVEGYVDEGKVIKNFHTFTKAEREIVKGKINKENGFADVALEIMGKKEKEKESPNGSTQDVQKESQDDIKPAQKVDSDTFTSGDVIFRPSTRIILPTNDINIDFERRNNSKYSSFAMVTSVAHVWFNTYFEGRGPEQNGKPDSSGVFEIEFDAMDGIKGSSRKGTRAFDRMAVVWKTVEAEGNPGVVITEPKEGEIVPQARPADWKRGNDEKSEDFEKKLGMREAQSESAEISRASSVRSDATAESKKIDEFEGVRPFSESKAEGTNNLKINETKQSSKIENEPPATIHSGATITTAVSNEQVGKTADQLSDIIPTISQSDTETAKLPSTADLPGGKTEDQIPSHHDHLPGSVKLGKNVESSS